ncbi:MAG: COX15/CtaA family protein [Cyanobacteriota bacterium]|nr:COX15/CtaA family protein [Cyanobacteriota bacterium]
MPLRPLLRLLTTHLVVALVALVVIGGATRVMEAGLACPDWPLCYGVLLPGRQMNLQVFLEWFHRLDAFLVGLALLVLWAASLWRRQQLPSWLPWISSLALGLVVFQGALGALTVTGLLSWSTVTAHLATALLLLVLMSALDQTLATDAPPQPPPSWWFPLPWLSTALVFSQCVLGGAMASQWAVDHCFTSGDQCEWLLRHRQLALPAGLTVVAMAGALLLSPRTDGRMRALSLGAATLVVLQVALGILTLRSQLQLPSLTIAHQLVAALLMAHLGALMGRTLQAWLQKPAPSSLEVSCG